MLCTTAFNTFKESLVQTQYQPTRPGMMITVGRVSDGKLLDSFKTQSRATSPPSNSDNISLRNSNTLTTWTTRTVHAAAVNIVFHTGGRPRTDTRLSCRKWSWCSMSSISTSVVHCTVPDSRNIWSHVNLFWLYLHGFGTEAATAKAYKNTQ